jgi:hypothetical protein
MGIADRGMGRGIETAKNAKERERGGMEDGSTPPSNLS